MEINRTRSLETMEPVRLVYRNNSLNGAGLDHTGEVLDMAVNMALFEKEALGIHCSASANRESIYLSQRKSADYRKRLKPELNAKIKWFIPKDGSAIPSRDYLAFPCQVDDCDAVNDRVNTCHTDRLVLNEHGDVNSVKTSKYV